MFVIPAKGIDGESTTERPVYRVNSAEIAVIAGSGGNGRVVVKLSEAVTDVAIAVCGPVKQLDIVGESSRRSCFSITFVEFCKLDGQLQNDIRRSERIKGLHVDLDSPGVVDTVLLQGHPDSVQQFSLASQLPISREECATLFLTDCTLRELPEHLYLHVSASNASLYNATVDAVKTAGRCVLMNTTCSAAEIRGDAFIRERFACGTLFVKDAGVVHVSIGGAVLDVVNLESDSSIRVYAKEPIRAAADPLTLEPQLVVRAAVPGSPGMLGSMQIESRIHGRPEKIGCGVARIDKNATNIAFSGAEKSSLVVYLSKRCRATSCHFSKTQLFMAEGSVVDDGIGEAEVICCRFATIIGSNRKPFRLMNWTDRSTVAVDKPFENASLSDFEVDLTADGIAVVASLADAAVVNPVVPLAANWDGRFALEHGRGVELLRQVAYDKATRGSVRSEIGFASAVARMHLTRNKSERCLLGLLSWIGFGYRPLIALLWLFGVAGLIAGVFAIKDDICSISQVRGVRSVFDWAGVACDQPADFRLTMPDNGLRVALTRTVACVLEPAYFFKPSPDACSWEMPVSGYARVAVRLVMSFFLGNFVIAITRFLRVNQPD